MNTFSLVPDAEDDTGLLLVALWLVSTLSRVLSGEDASF